AEQAVADARGKVAAAADAAQQRPQIGVLARRAPLLAGICRAFAEDTMRDGVELAADALEDIGDAVDDGFEEAGERTGAARVQRPRFRCPLVEGAEDRQRLEADRDE